MAKKPKTVVNMSLLASIASGATTRISQADGLPLVEAGYIQVNTSDVVDGNAACQITDAGKAILPGGSAAKAAFANSDTPLYAVMTNVPFVPNEKKRAGRSGAKTIYPWATMEVGNTFFVPVSAKHADPFKSMTSAVSSANMKYSEPTGEKKTVTRAKRGPGNKAVLDASGAKVMETKEVDVMRSVRKFDLRPIVVGDKFGDHTFDQAGALVARVS